MAEESLAEKPVLEVKPAYYFSVIFPRWLPLLLFMAVFCSGFLAVVMVLITEGLPNMPGYDGSAMPRGGLFMSLGACVMVFLACIAVFMSAMKQFYAKSNYRFFSDRVEFYTGFFTVTKKSVEYSKVLEVTMTSGPLQRPKNLGSILLLTAASAGNDRQAGVTITDIMNPDEKYNKIRQLVQGGKK